MAIGLAQVERLCCAYASMVEMRPASSRAFPCLRTAVPKTLRSDPALGEMTTLGTASGKVRKIWRTWFHVPSSRTMSKHGDGGNRPFEDGCCSDALLPLAPDAGEAVAGMRATRSSRAAGVSASGDG